MSGWLTCEKHGGLPPLHICMHIKKCLVDGDTVNAYRFPLFGNLVCETCIKLVKGSEIKDLELDDLFAKNDFEQIRLLSIYEQIDKKIPKSISCPVCIDKNLIVMKKMPLT